MAVDLMQFADDLAQFDAEFEPTKGRKIEREQLEDGNHEFEIQNPTITKANASKLVMVRLPLLILTGQQQGNVIEYTYFLKDTADANDMAADMKMLGLDADNWKTDGRQFSTEFPRNLPRLKGVHCMGRKWSNNSTDKQTGKPKTWHNIKLTGLCPDSTPRSLEEVQREAAEQVDPNDPF